MSPEAEEGDEFGSFVWQTRTMPRAGGGVTSTYGSVLLLLLLQVPTLAQASVVAAAFAA